MTQTRIYVPLNATSLRKLAAARELAPSPVSAHAVTQRLERAHAAADEEEREYAALCDAAAVASGLRVGPLDRRVVAAADVDTRLVADHRGEPSEVLSLVEVTEVVPLRRIVSFHVDDDGARDEDELLWYDATELDEVLRLVGS